MARAFRGRRAAGGARGLDGARGRGRARGEVNRSRSGRINTPQGVDHRHDDSHDDGEDGNQGGAGDLSEPRADNDHDLEFEPPPAGLEL